MYFLEVVCSNGNEENCFSHLLPDYDTVKSVLKETRWIRFVVRELEKRN